MDYAKLLLAVAPHGKAAIREGFAASLPQAIAAADLTTPERLAAFIGQCAHESDGFATTTEYASGKAYEGRKDLGNVQPGDGVRFKGRGLVQITGRENYRAAGEALGLPLENRPASAAEFPAAALTAGWYWKSRKINEKMSIADTLERRNEIATKAVNGGRNGLASRLAYSQKAFAALGDLKGALLAGAAEQTRKAATRARAASVATASASVSALTAAAPQSSLGIWAPLAIGVALAALGVRLFFAIRKHENAAVALTVAAREA